MLSISIMTVIVAALYGMFHHTQRALRANVSQVDVLEAGRSAVDQLTRELSLVSPTYVGRATNLMARLSPLYVPVVQPLMAGGAKRTNLLQEVVFMTRFNRDYYATAYRVLYASNGVGSLGKFTTNMTAIRPQATNFALLIQAATNQLPANFVTLVDGVIHFRLSPFDADGYEMNWETAYRYTNQVLYTNLWLGTNLFLTQDRVSSETSYAFVSNALPSCVELELAVLEPKAYEQFKAFNAGSPMASKFLSNHAAQVQLFRQRIPLRQAPPIQARIP